MRPARNPFRIRLAENIESEELFLRLFGTGMLGLLPDEELWGKVLLLQSAPGGGKTSLFRLFTPSVLNALHEGREVDELKDLYGRMSQLGVISDAGPRLLGVMLSCARNYSDIGDLGLKAVNERRLLYALVNARLLIATLRNALVFAGLRYPKDLARLRVTEPPDSDVPPDIAMTGSGEQVFEWARQTEREVFQLIDSFDHPNAGSVKGHDTLYSLKLLRPDCILVDDAPVAERILVLLDDVHRLSPAQRTDLLGALMELRPAPGVWLAERLEALSPTRLLAYGVTSSREYVEPIVLERFWRESRRQRTFENALGTIADKRAASARDVAVGVFETCLSPSLDDRRWDAQFAAAVDGLRARILEKTHGSPQYQAWVVARERMQGTQRERAVAWRSLEVLVDRELKRNQRRLNIDHDESELLARDDSQLHSAAEFLVAREFGVPYYFGLQTLLSLSSCNIDQFLSFAGDLFEEVISASLLGQGTALSPQRQESILRVAAARLWQELPRRIPNASDVRSLLQGINTIAQQELLKGTASYGSAGAVTGIAITMDDRARLLERDASTRDDPYVRLVDALASCLSMNLLEPQLDRLQGTQGKKWMVLYLNRWLCLHFGLPLHYGGWRPRTPERLVQWLIRKPAVTNPTDQLELHEH